MNINFPGGRESQVEKSRKFQGVGGLRRRKPPWGGIMNTPWNGNSRGVGGLRRKKPPWGGMDIFWNHTIHRRRMPSTEMRPWEVRSERGRICKTYEKGEQKDCEPNPNPRSYRETNTLLTQGSESGVDLRWMRSSHPSPPPKPRSPDRGISPNPKTKKTKGSNYFKLSP